MQLLIGGPEVGWYAAALRVIVSLHTFVWLYFFNLLPSLARDASGSRTGVRRIIGPSLQVTAWSAVFIGIVGMAVASLVIQLLYGPDYVASIGPLQILIWVIALTLLSGHYRYALIACGRQQLEFVTSAVGAGLNVALNLMLIPRFGMAGAAWSLVASEAIIWLVAYAFVHRTIASISFWPALRLPILAGSLASGAVRLLPTADLWLTSAITMLVYALVLSITQPTIFTYVRSVVAYGRAHRADAIS
jgi:O-antigen/teichoic acid export membrane protein